MRLELKAGNVPLSTWAEVYRGASAALDPSCWDRIAASAASVARIVERGEPVYGINTGFGKLANIRIEAADLGILQRNIVLSHAAGVGPATPAPVVRLMMGLKLASLAQGYSGVASATVQLLSAMLDRDLLPVVPVQGSVGASGDLAPLAHMSAAMIGVGQVTVGDEIMPAAAGLARVGLEPADARAQGRPGLAERDAVFHGVCPGRPVRSRARLAGGPGHRCAVDRRGQRVGYALRPAHPRAAPASGADRGRGVLARPAVGKRHPGKPSRRRRQDPGSLLPAMPAPGDGRLPRHVAPCRPRAFDRVQQRHRQSSGLRRFRSGAVGRQLPRRAGRFRRRHDCPGALRDRIPGGAAHRHARRSGPVGSAGVPDAQAWA